MDLQAAWAQDKEHNAPRDFKAWSADPPQVFNQLLSRAAQLEGAFAELLLHLSRHGQMQPDVAPQSPRLTSLMSCVDPRTVLNSFLG